MADGHLQLVPSPPPGTTDIAMELEPPLPRIRSPVAGRRPPQARSAGLRVSFVVQRRRHRLRAAEPHPIRLVPLRVVVPSARFPSLPESGARRRERGRHARTCLFPASTDRLASSASRWSARPLRRVDPLLRHVRPCRPLTPSCRPSMLERRCCVQPAGPDDPRSGSPPPPAIIPIFGLPRAKSSAAAVSVRQG